MSQRTMYRKSAMHKNYSIMDSEIIKLLVFYILPFIVINALIFFFSSGSFGTGSRFLWNWHRQLCSEDASVAQSVEQGTENPRVDGSIPSGGTTFMHGHAALFTAAAIMRI